MPHERAFREADTEWEDTVWNLLDHDIDEDLYDVDEEAQDQLLAKDAGGVHVRWRWKATPRRLGESAAAANVKVGVPDATTEEGEGEVGEAVEEQETAELYPFHGVLEVAVLSASGLRDISSIKIADITAFTDNTAAEMAVYSFLVYLVLSLFFYAYVMHWYPQDAGSQHTRNLPLLVIPSSCSDRLLVVLVFVTTTFTTVGYGNQADYGDKNGTEILTPIDKVGVIFNIIFGTAVLGVVMGVAGDYAHTKASVMLEKKMALLQWRKMQNENTIKNINKNRTNSE